MVRRYLICLIVGLLGWWALYFTITFAVDPYGVSPVQHTWRRVNAYKPRRLNIDRQLKPYEVWRHSPRTVLLGTSRIHQSIDPAVLNGTRFSPAYNASVPANTPEMNVGYLREYLRLDPRIHAVIIELFYPNFLRRATPVQESPPTRLDYLRGAADLLISQDALWDSLLTLAHNVQAKGPVFEIRPGGYLYYPPGHDAEATFRSYPAGIWKYHAARAGRFELDERAFQSVRELVDLARREGLELTFVVTPNHAYDDYYLEAMGGWPAIGGWLHQVSANATVYSFSQPNAWVYEEVGPNMRYWNDPYHFSLEMGAAMQRALVGLPLGAAPRNFMQRVTPELVSRQVQARRNAIRDWAKKHGDFVAQFEAERRRWEQGVAPAHPSRR